MEFEESRHELSLYITTLKEIDNLSELLLRYQNSSKLVAMKYKFDKNDNTMKHDLSDSLVRIEKIKERYQKKMRDCFILIELVQDKIDNIANPLYRNVLRRKYIQGQDLKVISIELDINARNVHKRALKSYSEVNL